MADERKYPDGVDRGSGWKVLIALMLFGVLIYFWGEAVDTGAQVERQRITYTEFRGQLDSGNISSVTIKGQEVTGEFRKTVEVKGPEGEGKAPASAFLTYMPPFQGDEIITELAKNGISINVEPEAGGSALWQFVVLLLPWVLIIGIWVLIIRRVQQGQGGAQPGLFNFGLSKAKLYSLRKSSVTFKDVAGLENAKAELQETVAFLKNPARFTMLGAKIPKGILLVGPPGTGKTLLARATAGEAGVPFFSISASEFVEMFVGVGASRVRDMFRKARETKPSIIFIDEIDSVGRVRGAGLGGGHDEREQTLNQLLSEMDGFEPHEEIIVVAATNRPDVLDPALLRPGRFDRHIVIDRPGWKDRKTILEVHSRNKRLAPDVDLEKIGKGTPGMTGADLENLANEAALEAVKKGKERIEMMDFEEARDRVIMGSKREETFSEEEKRITAYHEAGHALVSWELPHTDPIHKVSIIPRGMALGATQFLPEEDRHYYPKSYLVNRLCVALAGRAAEKLVFRDVSSGANDDLKNATALAEKMVAQWGMSDKVGPINFGRGEEHPFLGRDISVQKRYSESMAWLMDQEIRSLIVSAERKADEILLRDRGSLEELAAALIKDESLDKDEVEVILRRTKGVEPLRKIAN
ncbi:MAG TPA: cell division protein FtsH [Deltaproteobacteria bacterium]|nr:MAG: cell division protein FtsH [Deltaproteobacteria bacterium GWA2_55_82]OGQ64129.1 MAG: cell division protein FtsH [Deltaproteobacteria bacterium RIFCSPLOWO2_02_FULL_55_12]OIJ74581.1 MAG: cell division protein FtsH [Deltaproteobacteria bacterium GWC2_55_46]HBG46477.1 cell division protein FtsH [Deltaproteobacteria bacterium]HCY10689.1 cell division protein FtsH [Deltaproteobacteria bacterium]